MNAAATTASDDPRQPLRRSRRMSAGAAAKHGRLTVPLTGEQLIVAAALYWALASNRPFLSAALDTHGSGAVSTWSLAAALVISLVALNALLLGLLGTRHALRPVIGVLTVVCAVVSYYIGTYGVYVDPSMMRNVLNTDPAEAGELLTAALGLHVALYAGLPLLLLARVRIVRRPLLRAVGVRLGFVAVAIAVLAAAVLATFQPLASLMRNHREVRYLITPANVLWSVGKVATDGAAPAAKARGVIGADAARGASWGARRKPMILVLVVGETARAANWGLNGYARNTTPELAARGVFNFTQVTACGTSTEVSLPCMFAPVGRRDYDERRIRTQQSLLHVLARAGVQVQWRDNQSGCKGVCDGLPFETVRAPPGLCGDGRCADEALLHGLDDRLRSASGTQVLVLHMIGNHGPSYFRRYPEAFARFRPDCRYDELGRCSGAEIVNAFDNALLYTDHVLASAIDRLKAHAEQVDSALLFVSDHGESLGEQGLFLHGVPYAIAPRVQTQVPMIFWASNGFERGAGLETGCLSSELQRRSRLPLTHDHLFHTVLGLLDVRTALHEPSLDLVQACRDGRSHS